ALYDGLLAGPPPELEQPHLVKALMAANLWEYGHEAEARAIITGIRTAAPRDPAAWVIVAEPLEQHDALEAAHETVTEALTLLRPFPVAVLHCTEPELAQLVAAYPPLTAEYPSYAEHLATIESSLRELAASGTPNLGIVTGTVPSYEAFAASESSSPTDASLL